jgi:hypothetical protein
MRVLPKDNKMIFKKHLATFLNAFTDKPISEQTLTKIDIAVTVIATLTTIVGILIGFQFGLLASIVIAVVVLGFVPLILILALNLLQVPGKDSPYTPWTPVTPPGFVGRVKLLNQLASALEKNESISLVGDRRIGKTSVLKTWAQQVRAKKRLVIYVTGEEAEAATLSQFIHKITKQRATDDPEEAAEILSKWAIKKTKKSGFPPLILVDEAERFIENFPARFFERLRGMLDRVMWVFASREDIDLIYRKFHDSTSPFENRLGIRRLGLLEPAAVEQLIHLGRLTPEETALMHTWAGRHPFFLQLLGHSLLEGRGESIQMVLDEFQTEAVVRLRRVWKTLSDSEQKELRQCLTGKAATSRSLRVRGLVTEQGQLFGKVLESWVREEI